MSIDKIFSKIMKYCKFLISKLKFFFQTINKDSVFNRNLPNLTNLINLVNNSNFNTPVVLALLFPVPLDPLSLLHLLRDFSQDQVQLQVLSFQESTQHPVFLESERRGIFVQINSRRSVAVTVRCPNAQLGQDAWDPKEFVVIIESDWIDNY